MGLPTYIAEGGSEGSAINAPGNWPTMQNNDYVYLMLALGNATSPVLPGTPAGWTLQSTSSQVGTIASNTAIAAVWSKRMTASEGAPTFSGITGQRFFLACQIRGAATAGDPTAIITTNFKNVASTSASFDAGTASFTDLLVLYQCVSTSGANPAWSSEANSNLSSVTEQYDTGAGENNVMATSGGLAAGGAIGTFTATVSSGLDIYFGIAIKSTTSVSLVVNGGRSSLLGVGN